MEPCPWSAAAARIKGLKVRIKAMESMIEVTDTTKEKMDALKESLDATLTGFEQSKPIEEVFKPKDGAIKASDIMPDPESIRTDLTSYAEQYKQIIGEGFESGDEPLWKKVLGDPKEFVPDMLEAASQIVEIIGQFQQAANQKRLNDIDKETEAALKAAGDNAAKRDAIESAFAKKREEVELKAARDRKRIALIEASIQGALSIIKALGAGPIYAAITAAAVAAQIAVIATTQFKTGGYTGDGGASAPAGTVHKGEFVIDAPTTKAMGLRGMSMKDFRSKVLPAIVNPQLTQRVEERMSVMGGMGLDMDTLGDKIARKLGKEIQRMPLSVMTFDKDGFQQFMASGQTYQYHLQHRH